MSEVKEIFHAKRDFFRQQIRRRDIHASLRSLRTQPENFQLRDTLLNSISHSQEHTLNFLKQQLLKLDGTPSPQLFILGPILIKLLNQEVNQSSFLVIHESLIFIANLLSSKDNRQTLIGSNWPLSILIQSIMNLLRSAFSCRLAQIALVTLNNLLIIHNQSTMQLLQNGLLEWVFQQSQKGSLTHLSYVNLSYLLQSILSFRPLIPLTAFKSVIDTYKVLLRKADQEIQFVFMQAISTINSLQENQKIYSLLHKEGVLKQLVDWSIAKTGKEKINCLQVFMYFSRGSSRQTEMCIETECEKALLQLLNSRNQRIVEKSLMVFSNLFLSSAKDTKVLFNSQVINKLNELFNRKSLEIKQEVVYNYLSILKTGDVQIYKSMGQAFKNVTSSIFMDQPLLILKCLQCIQLFLNFERQNPSAGIKSYLKNTGCQSRIEELQNHKSQEIYSRAYHIIRQFLA